MHFGFESRKRQNCKMWFGMDCMPHVRLYVFSYVRSIGNEPGKGRGESRRGEEMVLEGCTLCKKGAICK